MPRKRNPQREEPSDFLAKVEFIGTQSEDSTPEDRVRIVHEILKEWTVRAHRRGRPKVDKGDLENAA